MKSCRGCKYLQRGWRDVCAADDGTWQYTVNPYTGRSETVFVPRPDAIDRSIFRPTVEEMRAPGRRCGPAALLWQPNVWQRIKAALR